ncbi:MAG TPA: DUF2892 domain-containing protein [Roseiarcus sp.]|nr:DUF2892 domain-containing protein [Roseiarcus sp.]
MSGNIGLIDRAVRIIVGALLIAFAAGFVFPHTGWNWLGWISVVPLLTAIIGVCPLYSALGFSTLTSAERQPPDRRRSRAF